MTANRRDRDNTKTADRQVSSISSSSTTSTTTLHTDPGVSWLSPYEMETIREVYEDVLGPINTYKAQAIGKAIACGLTMDAVIDAIEQTAMAARPSHAYLAAILRRYASYGLTTKQAAERDRETFAARREAANRERAVWYRSPDEDMPW